MKAIAHHTARWTLVFCLLFIILVAVFTGAARISLPFVGAYRAEIQKYVTDYLGKPVELGTLDLSWHRFGPRLQLDDVVLQSGVESEQDVHLQKIYLDLDLLRSWINGGWQISEVVIEGANLSVEYLGERRFRVYGFQIDGNQPRDAESLDVLGWLMSADYVALRNSSVRFTYSEKNFSLDMRNLNIWAKNTPEKHEIRLDARVPSLSKNTLSAGVDFIGTRSTIENSSGRFTLNISKAELGKLSELFKSLPAEMTGLAKLDLWGVWFEKRLQKIRINSNLQSAVLMNKSSKVEMKLPNLISDISLINTGKSQKLTLHKLEHIRDSEIDSVAKGVLQIPENQNKNWHLYLSGSSTKIAQLDDLVKLVKGFKGSERLVEYYEALQPTGQLRDWQITIERQDGIPNISAKLDFRQLQNKSYRKIPGVEGLNGHVELVNNRGKISLYSDKLSLDMPFWMDNKIHLEHASSDAMFSFSQDEFRIRTTKLTASNEHFAGTGDVFLHKKSGVPTYMDISANIPTADAKYASLYYPIKRMKPRMTKWLKNSIKQGSLKNVVFSSRGTSKGFPYADRSGRFFASFDMQNGRVEYQKNWPEVHSIDAKVVFSGPSIAIHATKAQSRNSLLRVANILIEDTKSPVLNLKANINADLMGMVDFIKHSPLKKSLGTVVEKSKGNGELALSFNMDLNLSKNNETNFQPKYNGQLTFANANWHSDLYSLDLARINGSLDFTEHSLTIDNLTTFYFDEPMRVTAEYDENQPQIISTISINGSVAANQVLSNYQLPIDHWFSGKAPWEVKLTLLKPKINEQGMDVSFEARSKLRGTVVELPVPFDKIAATDVPVNINTLFTSKRKNRVWAIDYDNILTANISSDKKDQQLRALHVGLNEDVTTKGVLSQGIGLYGTISKLSFDGWVSEISNIISILPESEKKEILLPVEANLKIQELLVGKRSVGSAAIFSQTDKDHLHISLGSQWLAGSLHYPRIWWEKNRPLAVELALLDKRFLDALATGNSQDERIDPRVLPPLNMGVGKFIWDDIQVADMKLHSEPVADGMHVKALGFVHDHLQMSGEANWRLRDPQSISGESAVHHTDLNFRILSDDIGKGMDAIGVAGAFDDGQGEINVGLAWKDAAYAPTLIDLEGDIKFGLENGRFLAVEPGAAKILGLFALQAIPRRLVLDFKDLTNNGLDYEKISGELALLNGVADTTSMFLEGPIGVVTSSGSTDYVSDTYSQTIVVLPRLSSTLPIIGLLSGGAAAGVGVLVVNQLLKSLGFDFDQVGRREYKLSGSWDNPQIDRVFSDNNIQELPDNR